MKRIILALLTSRAFAWIASPLYRWLTYRAARKYSAEITRYAGHLAEAERTHKTFIPTTFSDRSCD